MHGQEQIFVVQEKNKEKKIMIKWKEIASDSLPFISKQMKKN